MYLTLANTVRRPVTSILVTNFYKDLGFSQLFDHYGFDYNYYFSIKKDNGMSIRYADSMLYLFKAAMKIK